MLFRNLQARREAERWSEGLRRLQELRLVDIDAGLGAVAGVTADGRIALATREHFLVIPASGKSPFVRVAVSKLMENHLVGLRADGTCWVGPALNRINATAQAWQDVRQVAVSDAVFAVHGDGSVSHVAVNAPARGGDPYAALNAWRGVRKVVPCLQDGVAGLTGDGRVLLAGPNPGNHAYAGLAAGLRARDLCFLGSEAERIYWIDLEGVLRCSADPSDALLADCDALASAFDYSLLVRRADGAVRPINEWDFHGIRIPDVRAFSIGYTDYARETFAAVLAASGRVQFIPK